MQAMRDTFSNNHIIYDDTKTSRTMEDEEDDKDEDDEEEDEYSVLKDTITFGMLTFFFY